MSAAGIKRLRELAGSLCDERRKPLPRRTQLQLLTELYRPHDPDDLFESAGVTPVDPDPESIDR